MILYTIVLWILWGTALVFVWFRFPLRRDNEIFRRSLPWLLGIFASFYLITIMGLHLDSREGKLKEKHPTWIFSYDNILSEGTKSEAEQGPTDNNIWWHTYYLLVDAGNQHSYAKTQGGLWLVGILGLFSLIFLNGLLISAVMTTLDRHKEKWRDGVLRYKKYALKDHIVIIGGNDMVAQIVKHKYDEAQKNRKGKKNALDKTILILTSRDVDEFRRELKASLNFSSWRLVIYYGDRSSESDIEQLHLDKASEVFVLGEESSNDDADSYHDTLNMSCVQHITNCLKNRKTPLPCHVMFEYQTTFAALQLANISVADSFRITLKPFNYYEMWCQKCFGGDHKDKEGKEEYYIPLDGEGIKENDKTFVHLVIIGMSRMGVAMGHTAAHLAHYPNFVTDGVRTRITFIDTNADTERDFLKGRYHELFKLARHRTVDTTIGEKFNPNEEVAWENEHYSSHLGKDFIDVEWEFVKGGIESDNVRRYLVKITENTNARLTVAVCLPESNAAVATAIYLPDKIYEKAQQVLVYQRKNGVVVDRISTGNARYKNKLRAFGMISKCYAFDMIEELERLSEYVSRKYGEYDKLLVDGFIQQHPLTSEEQQAKDIADAKAQLNKAKIKQIRENIRKGKNILPGDLEGLDLKNLEWSNYYNILSLRSKMRSYGLVVGSGESFDAQKLAIIGQVEHNRWLTEKLLQGYKPLPLQGENGQEKFYKEAQEDGATSPNIITGYATFNNYTERRSFYDKKGKLKKLHSHLDICSNEILAKVDPESVGRDGALIKYMPLALDFYKSYQQGIFYDIEQDNPNQENTLP